MRIAATILLLGLGPVAARGQDVVLRGRVISADTREPLFGARVTAVACGTANANGGPTADTPQGRFVLSLPDAGPHCLVARSIGFKMRRDSIPDGYPADSLIEIALQPDTLRMGPSIVWQSPPDSLVARVRAAKASWRCASNAKTVETERRKWADFMGSEPWPDWFLKRLGRAAMADSIRPVRDDATCRRAAEALDDFGYAASLEYFVFRRGDYFLVTQRGSDQPTILDRNFKRLMGFIQ